MDAAATVPAWVQARNKEILRQRKQRSADIFQGSASWERASIAGIDVHRLSVSPSITAPVPASFAVVGEPSWSKVDAVKGLPHNLEWQQSQAGRFDFFFQLAPGVQCFGLGERFSSLNLRGKTHTLCSTDNPKHNEAADALYKSVPFIIISKGPKCTAFFLDSPAPQIWDLDSDLSNTANVDLYTRRGWQLYVFAEGTLAQMVAAFTALTGRHALPPLWSLGHQQSRWSYPDQDSIRYIADQYRRRKIPCDTIVLDIDYMDEYRVFTHCKERFPSFKSLSKEMAAQSFKLITIVDPGIKQDEKYKPYQEALASKLICYSPDGKPFSEKVWPGLCVFPDFLKPETRKWWADQHAFYIDSGIAGIWNDMNEPAFFDVRNPLPEQMEELPPMNQHRFTQTGPEGTVGHLEVRNLYGMTMSQATHEALVTQRPDERPFVLTRSGYAGLQRFSAVWLGDNMSWFEHLRKSIPMMLNIGLSGIAFAGVDIGGFGGSSDAELLVRWYELGIFYPFFRNHCALDGCAQEPWAFGPVAELHIKKLIETRYQMLPYIQTLFWEHHKTGAPLMRPLSWHFPDDAIAADIDDQFMFGSDIIVAPIVERGHSRRPVYLPKGLWHPFEGGEPLDGGKLHSIAVPLGTVPAFVRDQAIIPLADVVQSTEQYQSTPIEFRVYGERASGRVIFDDGRSPSYATGQYREVELTFASNKLSAKTVHDGFAPKHKFYVRVLGNRSSFELV